MRRGFVIRGIKYIKMAFSDGPSTEAEVILQQIGVVRRSSDAHCSQNKYSAGIQIPQGIEVSPRSSRSVADGNDIVVEDVDQSMAKFKDVKGVPAVDQHSGHAETRLQREREKTQLPLPDNHKTGTSVTHQSMTEGEKKMGIQLFLHFVAVISVVLCNNSVVVGNEVGIPGITSIVLDSNEPPSSGKSCFSGIHPIMKNGALKQNCRCCKDLLLTESQILTIINISERELCDYWCQILPPSGEVCQFPLKGLLQLCSNETSLKGNGHKEVEVRRNDSRGIYKFNITRLNGIVVAFPATNVKGTGNPYCKIRSIDSDTDGISTVGRVTDQRRNQGLKAMPSFLMELGCCFFVLFIYTEGREWFYD